MSNSTAAPTTANRLSRIEALLDAALDTVARQMSTGPVTAQMLKAVVDIAKAAGIDIAKDGVAASPAVDHILESMADIDPDLFLQ